MSGAARYCDVPIISAFFGVVIRMFYRDHEPAHVHAEHSGEHARFDLDGRLMSGEITSRQARQRIRRWTRAHRAELEANWKRMKAGQALERIEPLSREER